MNTDSNRSPLARTVALAFLGLAFVGFCLLGVWQVKRLGWKLDLIERVESRIHASPTYPPMRTEWSRVTENPKDYEYRAVSVGGYFLKGLDTRVDALTERGAGDWILSPFRAQGGEIILINRGFVPKGAEYTPSPYDSDRNGVIVIGLLRISEPHGRFLRTNVPAQDRWFSRDVQAIAAKRGLRNVAPYFVDDEFNPAAPPWPRGGMTVVSFRNNHLQYALTWFALALLATYAAWRFAREGRARE